MKNGQVDMAALEISLEIIAEPITPDALVLIETTVAPGTTEQVAYPIMRKMFRKRGIESDPLLAHSFKSNARQELCCQHPRFLEGLQRDYPRGHQPGGKVSRGSDQYG